MDKQLDLEIVQSLIRFCPGVRSFPLRERGEAFEMFSRLKITFSVPKFG